MVTLSVWNEFAVWDEFVRLENKFARLQERSSLERSQNRQARVACLLFATAPVKVEIGPATRAQPLAVFAAERTAGERKDELLGDQRSKIDLIAVIERKFQVLGAQPPVVVVGRGARRQYETKRTRVGRAELLRAARARRDHRRAQPAFEKQLHTGAVV